VKNSNKAATKSQASKTSSDQVSELTTNRLSVYLRCLNALEEAGVRTISSQALAEQFHLNAAQIRKDLAYFGEFGVRGVGYYVRDLKRHLRQILGLDRNLRVGIIGAGNLGLALADYPGFRQEGFEILARFCCKQARMTKSPWSITDRQWRETSLVQAFCSSAVPLRPAPCASAEVETDARTSAVTSKDFNITTLQFALESFSPGLSLTQNLAPAPCFAGPA